jgi:hypothetical protein
LLARNGAKTGDRIPEHIMDDAMARFAAIFE